MRNSKCKINKLRITVILIVLIIFLTFFTLRAIEKSIEPKIRDICEYYCKSEISQIISSSVCETIEMYQIDYNDIAVKVKENGKISAVDIRTENVNKIRSAIIENISRKFENNYINEISIPLGNVSDLFFLSGKGPEIEVQFLPEASVTAQIKSNFSGAGINQTKHTLYVEICVEAIAVLPTENIEFNVNSDCILAESLFMGDIPHGLISYSNT